METHPGTESADTGSGPLPLSSLRLLAPPLRLVSAAMWQVMKQRDVLHYDKLEEFVTSVTDTVPNLLSYRHQAKLALGLRARLILELCRGQLPPDPHVVLPHLERMRPSSGPSKSTRKADPKVEASISNFHELVQELLKNPMERKHFFQEVFPVEYGPQFDKALEKLLWEFLVRLDQLLPVPDLAQTVQWLSTAPAVLEECAQSVSQPQLLRALLQHQKCLGHLVVPDLSFSLGDSILSSLSLPPSGRVQNDKQPTATDSQSDHESDSLDTKRPQHCRRAHKGSDVRSVTGTMGDADLPLSDSAKRETKSIEAAFHLRKEESRRGTDGSGHHGTRGRSRLCSDISQRTAEREERDKQTRRKQQHEEEEEDDGRARGKKQGEDVSFGSRGRREVERLVEDCMNSRPRVLLQQLCLADIQPPVELRPLMPDGAVSGPSSSGKQGMGSPAHKASRKRKLWNSVVSPRWKFPETTDKENCADSPVTSSPSLVISPHKHKQGRTMPSPEESEIVLDSEDEETKNFKGRLFIKRYFRTKHNTYVPTLREFWKPRLAQPGLLSLSRQQR